MHFKACLLFYTDVASLMYISYGAKPFNAEILKIGGSNWSDCHQGTGCRLKILSGAHFDLTCHCCACLLKQEFESHMEMKLLGHFCENDKYKLNNLVLDSSINGQRILISVDPRLSLVPRIRGSCINQGQEIVWTWVQNCSLRTSKSESFWSSWS